MKIFVTGASGYIGSHLLPLLIANGHQVYGLARSEEASKKVASLGANVVHGSLSDLDVLEAASRDADAVIHLAFIHDFANFENSVKADLAATAAFRRALKGTNKLIIGTAGTLIVGGTKEGHPIDDFDDAPRSAHARAQCEVAFLELNQDNIRAAVVRLAPFVYGDNGHGFLAMFIDIAKKAGFAPYIGDGSAKLTVLHINDAARLYALAVEKAKAGSVYHGVGQTNVSFKELAEAVGKLLKLPTKSLTLAEAAPFFPGFFSSVFSTNHQVTAKRGAAELGWTADAKYDVLADILTGSYSVRGNSV